MEKGTNLTSCEEVLDRVLQVSDSKNDAALGRALGVSRQTVSTWRKRGTIPYEAITQYAYGKEISLDYLLLGRGSREVKERVVDADLVGEIAELIRDESKSLPALAGVYSVRDCAYFAALIYEKTASIDDEEAKSQAIHKEVNFLFQLLARNALMMNPDLEEGTFKDDIPELEKIAQVRYTPGSKKLAGAEMSKFEWGKAGPQEEEFRSSIITKSNNED